MTEGAAQFIRPQVPGIQRLGLPKAISARKGADSQGFIYGGDLWTILIIGHGYLVREFYTFNVLIPARFDMKPTQICG